MRVSGLTSAEAARRFVVFGPNEAVPARRLSWFGQLLHLFANPLVVILLVASGVSAALGQSADALIIVTMVVIGISIDFWQNYRSERAVERLRSSVAPTATVERDGTWREIPRRDVVPGDLLRLTAGDLVPADARLIESRDLSVQEASLTGESLPVDKQAGLVDSSAADERSLVFLGTSVVSGTATVEALATGPQTRFGDIARRLGSRPPVSDFEHGLRRFSLLILRTTIALVLFILVVSLALRRDPFESLLFAVALGVGLTPEFLPMITSVTLTAGALRMARDGVIVKHLPAIQNFGSMDVLCSDKTGTLTTGEMRCESAIDAAGAASERSRLFAVLNSRFETGIRSPLDLALLDAASPDVERYQKVDEIPFDFERRRSSVIVDTPDGRRCLVTKGAPEPILALATGLERDGGIVALDQRSATHASNAISGWERMGCVCSPWPIARSSVAVRTAARTSTT